jgi:carbamoyl-phosphate synthase large subunit
VLEREQPVGVCIQFGGQTPLKLARAIERAGFRILGTPYDAIDLAEDRARFAHLAADVGVRCPEWGIAESAADATAIAAHIGYPVLVRPSYVLGGRSMRVCYEPLDVEAAMAGLRGPVLVDRFLESAIELDVDALCDGAETYVAAVMEHVEEAGIHSGDSSCVLPAPSDGEHVRAIVRRLGPALGVVGLLNVQLAITPAPAEPAPPSSPRLRRAYAGGGEVYVLEVNPRASRTVPFASKATGVNLVDAACRLAAGAKLAELELPPEPMPDGHHVKAAVLPFARFPGADPVLGPEMRSTGEVMASAGDFASAFAKAERAAGRRLPTSGRVFLSVRDRDKAAVLPVARALLELGFELVATTGTAIALADEGIPVMLVEKGEPVVHLVRRRGVDLVVNTPEGRNARTDGYAIREAAVVARVPCITTLAVARAAVEAIENALAEPAQTLQERHAQARAS